MLGAERMQDSAATRISNEDWFLHAEGANHLEDVGRAPLRVVPRRRVIRPTSQRQSPLRVSIAARQGRLVLWKDIIDGSFGHRHARYLMEL
jgi:hypothetical protein